MVDKIKKLNKWQSLLCRIASVASGDSSLNDKLTTIIYWVDGGVNTYTLTDGTKLSSLYLENLEILLEASAIERNVVEVESRLDVIIMELVKVIGDMILILNDSMVESIAGSCNKHLEVIDSYKSNLSVDIPELIKHKNDKAMNEYMNTVLNNNKVLLQTIVSDDSNVGVIYNRIHRYISDFSLESAALKIAIKCNKQLVTKDILHKVIENNYDNDVYNSYISSVGEVEYILETETPSLPTVLADVAVGDAAPFKTLVDTVVVIDNKDLTTSINGIVQGYSNTINNGLTIKDVIADVTKGIADKNPLIVKLLLTYRAAHNEVLEEIVAGENELAVYSECCNIVYNSLLINRTYRA